MHESPWQKEVEKAAEDRGEARGRAIGVRSVLEARFGSVPEELGDALVREKDLDKLSAWLRQAATAASLDAFRQAAGI